MKKLFVIFAAILMFAAVATAASGDHSASQDSDIKIVDSGKGVDIPSVPGR